MVIYHSFFVNVYQRVDGTYVETILKIYEKNMGTYGGKYMESICKVWNICGNYMNTWNIWKTHRFPSTYEYMEKCEYMEDMWNIYGNYMETIWKNIWENMGEHIENMISVVYGTFFLWGTSMENRWKHYEYMEIC